MQRNSRRSQRNQKKREEFEATLHAVPDHRTSSPRPARTEPRMDGDMSRSKGKHPSGRQAGPPPRTSDGLWLRTERDGTPMINVGLTEVQISQLILLIDDDEQSEEPDEDVLDAARRKLVNRLNRMKQILAEQEAAQAEHR